MRYRLFAPVWLCNAVHSTRSIWDDGVLAAKVRGIAW